MLLGPFPITRVDVYVTQQSPGVYLFSRDGKTAAYVGRSDTDLNSRIKQSVQEGLGHTYFWFEYTSSSKDAYLKECDYYHKYNPKDNVNHPAAPLGMNWRCPVIGCRFS